MSKLPCSKNCPKRQMGCHSICPEYIEFRKEREELYARKLEIKRTIDDYHKVRQKHKKG